MIVRSLRLRNFRNYAAQEIQLPAGLIALTGDNGQGKTNLLEALCVLATTKSPLVERDRELMRWEQNETRLAAKSSFAPVAPAHEYSNTAGVSTGNTVTRDLRAGGVPQSALASWLGQLQVVAFFRTIWSSSLANRANGAAFSISNWEKPSRALCRCGALPSCVAAAQRTFEALDESRFKGRAPMGNAAEGLGTLSEWNKQLITYGSRILAQRAQFLHELAPILAEVHRDLSGRDEVFSVNTRWRGAARTDVSEYSNEHWTRLFQNALEADHENDMRRGTTNSGRTATTWFFAWAKWTCAVWLAGPATFGRARAENCSSTLGGASHGRITGAVAG
jgi:DNA replication and repair protein RecF